MPSSSKKVLVVGNGIVGRTIAYGLLKKRHHVTVVEDDCAKSSASFAAQGLSSIKGLVFPRSNLFGMKVHGHFALLRLLNELEEKAKVQILSEGCVYEPYQSDEHKDKVFNRIYGHQFSEVFHKKQIKFPLAKKFPLLESYQGALFYPKDFVYDPIKLMKTLEAQNTGLGLEYKSARVEKLELKSDQKIEVFGERLNQSGQSSNERNLYDSVFICAGIESQNILKKSALPYQKTRKIAGVSFECENSQLSEYANFGFIKGKHSVAKIKRRIFLGSTSQNINTQSEEEIKSEGFRFLENISAELLVPNVHSLFTSPTLRYGIRACYENMLPQVEQINVRNESTGVWVVSGMYKNGYQIAPWAAEKIAATF